VCSAFAQFRSTVPLVVAPTTVTDSKGRNVDGLTAADLILFDNNVPQKIQLDWTAYPIDLVVAVETSANSGAVIEKLGGTGILFTQLLAAYGGETAVISFSDEVKIRQDFTSDPELVIRALRTLRKEGEQAHMLDAMHQALGMLNHRPPGRRRIILMIAEKRDRASITKLPEVMEQVERTNAVVYWLTYSPFLEPFTDRTLAPPEVPPGGYNCILCAVDELIRLHQPDAASLFANTTGGRTMNILKKSGLEKAIQVVSEEVHRQYILSFQPKSGEPGEFHSIRAAVKNRPGLRAKTRDGYWTLE
jgi:VWFA-related protein